MSIRPPNVAGLFYPADPAVLEKTVRQFLSVPKNSSNIKKYIRAIISPHAGYIYCGQIMGSVYQLLENQYSRVIILGPSHHFMMSSIAFDSMDCWQTPLGKIYLSKTSINNINFTLSPPAFDQEHSLEVQLPFLQTVLKDFQIIPFCCGYELKHQEIARKISSLLDEKTLIIVSSDFSNYHPQEIAVQKDHQSITAIKQMNYDQMIKTVDACGKEGILILNEIAKINGWKPELVCYQTSAAVSNDLTAVVGYAGLIYQ